MLLDPQLPLPSSPVSKEEPRIEETIGAMAAHIGALLCQSLLDYRTDGKQSEENRVAGARALALLYTLKQENPLVDFEVVVRLHGKKALYDHLAAIKPSPGDGTDAWIEYLLASVLSLLAQVRQKRVH
jgi:hypothetical protein